MNLPIITSAADYDLHFNDEVWSQVASLICARHHLPHTNLRRSPLGENIIFMASSAFVIKIFAPFRSQYLRERAALEFAQDKLAIKTPQLLHTGELEGWPYLVMSYLKGLPAREVWAEIEERERLRIVTRLGVAIRELHSHAPPLSEDSLNRDWQAFVDQKAHESVERQRACGANPEWVESLPAYISARLPLLPTGFRRVMLHGDIHPGNVLLAKKNGRWQVAGLFDFGDSFCGFHEYEFVAPGVLMVQGRCEEQKALLIAYGYNESELDLNLRARLMLLTILYECSDLRKYALRLSPDAAHLTLNGLERAIWTFVTD